MPSEPLSKALAKKFPMPPGDMEQTCAPLIAVGPDAVRELVGLVGDEFGDPNGVNPKYLLHGLALYASRAGAETERKMVAEALAATLSAQHSDELKAFVTRQLQLCGRPDDVPALGALLDSDRLCEPAAQALQAIGGREARNALKKALAKADGGRKATLRQAVKFLSEQE